jgi:hypothetical protein
MFHHPTHCGAPPDDSSSDEEFYNKKIRARKIPGYAMLEPITEVSFFIKYRTRKKNQSD